MKQKKITQLGILKLPLAISFACFSMLTFQNEARANVANAKYWLGVDDYVNDPSLTSGYDAQNGDKILTELNDNGYASVTKFKSIFNSNMPTGYETGSASVSGNPNPTLYVSSSRDNYTHTWGQAESSLIYFFEYESSFDATINVNLSYLFSATSQIISENSWASTYGWWIYTSNINVSNADYHENDIFQESLSTWNLNSHNYSRDSAYIYQKEDANLTIKTNTLYSISTNLYIKNYGFGSITGFLDPVLTLDPNTQNSDQIDLVLSTFIGNTPTNSSPVPVPTTMPLFGAGLICLWFFRKKCGLASNVR